MTKQPVTLKIRLNALKLYFKLKNPEKYIPTGSYCYKINKIVYENGVPRIKKTPCVFWDYDKNQDSQNYGYCHFLKSGDWFDELHGPSLLWDMCKECGINDSFE